MNELDAEEQQPDDQLLQKMVAAIWSYCDQAYCDRSLLLVHHSNEF